MHRSIKKADRNTESKHELIERLLKKADLDFKCCG